MHHPDSPKRHQGNPAQIGNGSQILGNGLELVDLMRKSGWLCSHCSPGAPNKALTGGSAGGGDPRREQREWEWYWAAGPAHTNTHPSTSILKKNINISQAHVCDTHRCRLKSWKQTHIHSHTPEQICLMQTDSRGPTHPKSSRGDEQLVALPPAMQFSHTAKDREPTSGNLAELTALSSQNQLGP